MDLLTSNIWPPPSRIHMVGKGTPGAAQLSNALKSYDDDFIILAQGHHHKKEARIETAFAEDFTHVSTPEPVYRNDPAGVRAARLAACEWQERFFGIPPEKEFTMFVQNMQGRYAHGHACLTLADYHNGRDLNVVAPGLRWRVLDDHFRRARTPVSDYDGTAKNLLEAIKDAVRRAGGAEKVGMLYLNSPNNPTGRRITVQEYRDIKEYVVSLNEERVANGLSKIIIFLDDPYFEACDVLHVDEQRARTGVDPYLDIRYHALFESSVDMSPLVFFHSFSKFAEQAGSHGITLTLSTDPKFSTLYTNELVGFGGLGWDEAFMEKMAETFSGGVHDGRQLKRCRDVQELFSNNWNIMQNVFEGRLLSGVEDKMIDKGMVECLRVRKEDFEGCEVVYPNEERLTIDTNELLVETLGNFCGVGLVPEKDDRQIKAEGYDSENEVLIRVALNDPSRFEEGMLRTQKGLQQIRQCVREQRPLQRMSAESPALHPQPMP